VGISVLKKDCTHHLFPIELKPEVGVSKHLQIFIKVSTLALN
jgi:hypothetical protein